jgi:putative methionine-R-sulfoxide reductase with GAF domain
MSDKHDETNDSKRYVGRVQEEVQRYLREVLDDNHKLRLAVGGLRTENLTLTGELERLRTEADQYRGMQVHLHQQLTDIETASARYAEQYAQVEQQNSNLANLYVASYQLAGTVDRAAVLQAIQEIVANLIGSEEVGIYEMNDARTQLVLAASFGIDPIRLGRIAVGSGTIGTAASTGEIYVSDTNGPDANNITACIPLRIDGTVIGVIAIFGLLAHKPALYDVDREMFDLLAVHAATSLYCATLHAVMTGAAV